MPTCLGAELSRHFGTSAEVSSGHFGTALVPKCLGSEVSGYRFDNINFWAIVCKTVRPMLSDRCPVLSVCPVCLSATLVYCDQTAGWIKIKLGMQVGLGPGHTVSDGDLAV